MHPSNITCACSLHALHNEKQYLHIQFKKDKQVVINLWDGEQREVTVNSEMSVTDITLTACNKIGEFSFKVHVHMHMHGCLYL